LTEKDEIIAVGKITGAHGIRGEIRVTPYASLEGAVWKRVYVRGPRADRPMEATRVRPNKDVLIVALKGVSDRNAAEELTGLELCMRKADLPALDEDEYYYTDLIGSSVVTDDGAELGVVKDIIPTGSNDVLEVSGPRGTVLIPAIEAVVLEVDTDKARITVHLLEGLADEETGP